jgi:putative transposase
MDYGIKFRPNKPGSPHPNGKVERSQKTDRTEFYATVDLEAEDLDDQLALRQYYYNWDQPHSAPNGKIPNECFIELIDETPFYDDVSVNYQSGSERIQEANYRVDLELQRLKRSL